MHDNVVINFCIVFDQCMNFYYNHMHLYYCRIIIIFAYTTPGHTFLRDKAETKVCVCGNQLLLWKIEVRSVMIITNVIILGIFSFFLVLVFRGMT